MKHPRCGASGQQCAISSGKCCLSGSLDQIAHGFEALQALGTRLRRGSIDYADGMLSGIIGAHWLFYSTDAGADRAFFRDVLDLRGVDAGGGWLIFALPPSEVAVHPGEEGSVRPHADTQLTGAVLYLMCDDIDAVLAELKRRGVPCESIGAAEWGRFTTLQLPSGGRIGLYQPSHPTAA
jgi:hypothetical protein